MAQQVRHQPYTEGEAQRERERAADEQAQQEAERNLRAAKHVGETATRDETLSDIDALLDEIDGVLEENAEEFVNSYRQKGGQ